MKPRAKHSTIKSRYFSGFFCYQGPNSCFKLFPVRSLIDNEFLNTLFYCHLIRNVTQKRAAYFNNSNEDSLYSYFLTGLFGNVNGMVTEPLNELEIKLTKTFSYIPEDILLKVYVNVLKGESFPMIKDILRRMRVDGYLRPDVDDDLISFMFESMQLNLILFFREFDIKDSKLQHKISKYFAEFMGHGLLEDHKYSEMVSDLKGEKNENL
ncbi:TetR/AcrR family transcriptional regulator [Paenibacillus sp. FSL H8-0079]|uniref:TetR/AcrR family transcriptional regulator n=1 Tax=Paenibacillus sp. FSL H8-0079 TaxID=2921375 RepID=UPI0030EDEB24